MARRVFYSFHYKLDNWRAAKVRNIGAIEGNQPASDNDWEAVTKGGDPAIERWIDEEMKGRTCTVVLVGQSTAGRKWINYEIIESWKKGMGVLGIYIHNIMDRANEQAIKGTNPFSVLTFGDKPFSSIVATYDPPYGGSSDVYGYIATNLEAWIADAVRTRASY